MSENRFIAAMIPDSMRAELERAAQANERTLSGEIRLALKAHLADPVQPTPELPSDEAATAHPRHDGEPAGFPTDAPPAPSAAEVA